MFHPQACLLSDPLLSRDTGTPMLSASDSTQPSHSGHSETLLSLAIPPSALPPRPHPLFPILRPISNEFRTAFWMLRSRARPSACLLLIYATSNLRTGSVENVLYIRLFLAANSDSFQDGVIDASLNGNPPIVPQDDCSPRHSRSH